MNWFETLIAPPDGVAETQTLITTLDRCFVVGFANLGQAEWDALTQLERILAGSPLAEAVTDSIAAIRSNAFVPSQFAALAAARVSLQGAMHDALLAQLHDALDRPKSPAHPSPPITRITTPIHESVRHWLMEIALLGFARLEVETVTPFLKTLETLQADPMCIQLAALLTGFVDELLRNVPIADQAAIPSYRWVDLWSQAMMVSFGSAEIPSAPASGMLELFGMDLRQSAHVVSFVLHGVLESAENNRHVRITQTAYKVDAIRGDELWLLFPHCAKLLTAFSATKRLSIDDLPLLTTGDLIWDDGKATLGKKFKQMARADHFFAPSASAVEPAWTPPLTRHPIQLAAPICLDRLRDDNLIWDALRIDPATGFDKATLENGSKAFGLLRYDAGKWVFQPLTAATGSGTATSFIGKPAGKLASKPPKRSTVSMLQERASRLLRA